MSGLQEEDTPNSAACLQGWAGNLLLSEYIFCGRRLRWAGMWTEEWKWIGAGSERSLVASNSLSLPQSFHCNPCQRPAVADSRQDESPINHPTEDNKSYGVEFNQTKQESKARSLQEVRGAKRSSGTLTGIPTPSAHVPVPRAARTKPRRCKPKWKWRWEDTSLLQFTFEIPRKSTKGKVGRHQRLCLDGFFTRLDETNPATLPVTFFWLWFSLSVFLPFAFFQPVFNLLLWHLSLWPHSGT